MKIEYVLKYITLIEKCTSESDACIWECLGGDTKTVADKMIRYSVIRDYLMERIKRNEK